MTSVIRNIVRHSAVYGVGIVLRRLASVLLLPVYTRYLSPADYGTLELLTISTDVVALILGLGLTGALFKFLSAADSPEEQATVISTVALLIVAFYLLGSAMGIACAVPIATLVFETAARADLFRIVFATYFFLGLTEMGMRHLQARKYSGWYVLLSLGLLALQITLNLYFLIGRGLGVRALLYGNLIAQGIVGSGLMLYTLRVTGLRFSGALARRMLRYGVPLVFDSLAAFILTFSDRFFLNYYADIAEVGLYAVGYKFGFLLAALVQPFNAIWEAERFDIAKRADAGAVYRQVARYYLCVLTAAALGLALFARDIIQVMTAPEFHAASRVVWLIVIAYFFQSLITVSVVGVLVAGKTERVTLATGIAAVLCLGMCFVCVPRWQSYGAAIATVVPFAVRQILIYWFAQQHLRIPYDWGAAARICGLAALLLAVSFVVTVDSLPGSVLLHAGLWLLLPIGIYFGGVFSVAERAHLLAAVRQAVVTFRMRGAA